MILMLSIMIVVVVVMMEITDRVIIFINVGFDNYGDQMMITKIAMNIMAMLILDNQMITIGYDY